MKKTIKIEKYYYRIMNTPIGYFGFQKIPNGFYIVGLINCMKILTINNVCMDIIEDVNKVIIENKDLLIKYAIK